LFDPKISSRKWGQPITEQLAKCLIGGIEVHTGHFQFSSGSRPGIFLYEIDLNMNNINQAWLKSLEV